MTDDPLFVSRPNLMESNPATLVLPGGSQDSCSGGCLHECRNPALFASAGDIFHVTSKESTIQGIWGTIWDSDREVTCRGTWQRFLG